MSPMIDQGMEPPATPPWGGLHAHFERGPPRSRAYTSVLVGEVVEAERRQNNEPSRSGVRADSMGDNARLGSGVYGLLFEISRQLAVPTGRLGVRTYPVGWYAYIGSALGGISGRIRHHLRTHKRPHWHIDYLLPHGELSAIVVAETHQRVECLLAAFLAQRFRVVHRFGSSDCGCAGHLFWSEARAPLLDAMLEAVQEVGCSPKKISRPFSSETFSRTESASGAP